MTVSPFGSGYASAYDALYQDKDYEAEADEVARLFVAAGVAANARLLDIGCGTGRHGIALATRGYDVVGVDASPDMLARARDRAASFAGAGSASFSQGDARDFDVGAGQFDGALLMFAVLGYMTTNDDVRAALGNARRHLRPGGVLIFDVWYGPAVLRHRPHARRLELKDGDDDLVREVDSELDVNQHLCTVRYRLTRTAAGEQPQVTEERHVMRYFFPQELALFLNVCGLSLVELHAVGGGAPSEDSWNLQVVARAA